MNNARSWNWTCRIGVATVEQCICQSREDDTRNVEFVFYFQLYLRILFTVTLSVLVLWQMENLKYVPLSAFKIENFPSREYIVSVNSTKCSMLMLYCILSFSTVWLDAWTATNTVRASLYHERTFAWSQSWILWLIFKWGQCHSFKCIHPFDLHLCTSKENKQPMDFQHNDRQ